MLEQKISILEAPFNYLYFILIKLINNTLNLVYTIMTMFQFNLYTSLPQSCSKLLKTIIVVAIYIAKSFGGISLQTKIIEDTPVDQKRAQIKKKVQMKLKPSHPFLLKPNQFCIPKQLLNEHVIIQIYIHYTTQPDNGEGILVWVNNSYEYKVVNKQECFLLVCSGQHLYSIMSIQPSDFKLR